MSDWDTPPVRHTCPHCDGKGKFGETTFDDDSQEYYTEYTTCETCEGEGSVNEYVYDEYMHELKYSERESRKD